MHDARFHRGVSGDQRLTQYLSTEHLGCADVAALATKQIELDALELEEPEQVCETTVHSADCTQRRMRAANCRRAMRAPAGKGAGCWPTALAVLGDVYEILRAREAAVPAARAGFSR